MLAIINHVNRSISQLPKMAARKLYSVQIVEKRTLNQSKQRPEAFSMLAQTIPNVKPQ